MPSSFPQTRVVLSLLAVIMIALPIVFGNDTHSIYKENLIVPSQTTFFVEGKAETAARMWIKLNDRSLYSPDMITLNEHKNTQQKSEERTIIKIGFSNYNHYANIVCESYEKDGTSYQKVFSLTRDYIDQWLFLYIGTTPSFRVIEISFLNPIFKFEHLLKEESTGDTYLDFITKAPYQDEYPINLFTIKRAHFEVGQSAFTPLDELNDYTMINENDLPKDIIIFEDFFFRGKMQKIKASPTTIQTFQFKSIYVPEQLPVLACIRKGHSPQLLKTETIFPRLNSDFLDKPTLHVLPETISELC